MIEKVKKKERKDEREEENQKEGKKGGEGGVGEDDIKVVRLKNLRYGLYLSVVQNDASLNWVCYLIDCMILVQCLTQFKNRIGFAVNHHKLLCFRNQKQ